MTIRASTVLLGAALVCGGADIGGAIGHGPVQALASAPSITLPVSAPPSPPALGSGLIYRGPVATTTTDSIAGVQRRPPRPGDAPATPPTSCEGGDLVCGDGTGTVTLARATAVAAGSQGADGNLIPLFRDRLVYVMTWSRSVCATSGGIPIFSDVGTVSTAVPPTLTHGPASSPGTATTYVDALHPSHMLLAACG